MSFLAAGPSGAGYFQPKLTKAVRGLLIAIGVSFVLQLSLTRFAGIPVDRIFGFSPQGFLSGQFWQLITYPFLHGGLSHILFNCLILYMLGSELEARWGTKNFLKYYSICAIGGAIVHMLVWLAALVVDSSAAHQLGGIPIVGASGALYGLFVAFAVLYGEQYILVFFLFPMKAKYFVMLLAFIEIISAVFYSESGVAHLVHLGGLATGYLLLRLWGPNLRGGGGGFLRRKAPMSREEVKKRLSLIVDNDPKSDGEGKFPITWN